MLGGEPGLSLNQVIANELGASLIADEKLAYKYERILAIIRCHHSNAYLNVLEDFFK